MGTYKYFLNQEVIEGKRLIEEAVACGDFIATYIHGVILLCESNPEGIGNFWKFWMMNMKPSMITLKSTKATSLLFSLI